MSFCSYDGSPPRNIPPGASGDANTFSCPLMPFQVANDGYFLSRYFGMNQPMCPVSPFEPSSVDGLLLRRVLLVLGDVLPVLEHRVDLALRHRLVDRDLGDVGDLHLAAEVLLEHVLGDVGVGGRARPRLFVQRDRAAARLRRRRSAPSQCSRRRAHRTATRAATTPNPFRRATSPPQLATSLRCASIASCDPVERDAHREDRDRRDHTDAELAALQPLRRPRSRARPSRRARRSRRRRAP